MRAGVGFNPAVLSFGGEVLPVKHVDVPWYDLDACGINDGAVLMLAEGGAHNLVELREVVEAQAALDEDIEQVASHCPG